MKKIGTFLLGVIVLPFVVMAALLVAIWRMLLRDMFKYVYETGETAFAWLKARYDRTDTNDDEEGEIL